MGYMRHHAIIVTTSQDIAPIYRKALEIFDPILVGNIVKSTVNGYYSFFIGPDGSKEGWIDSMDGDTNRGKFIEYLESQRYSDNSSSINWVEIQYGDEERETKIVNDSDKIIREVGYNYETD